MAMTPKEHELVMLMFARLYEAIESIKETLKSRGAWTEDDERAFSHLVHRDEKLLQFSLQVCSDYTRLARNLGVATGLDELPDAPPPKEPSER
jgi:hypothetical protein